MKTKTARTVAFGVIIGVLVISAILLSINGEEEEARTLEKHPWKLQSVEPSNVYGAYLANGTISSQTGPYGVGIDGDTRLRCFYAGLYNEEKLVQVPNWSAVEFRDPVSGEKYELVAEDPEYLQTQDMKHAVLTTNALFASRSHAFRASIRFIVSRAQKHLSIISISVTPDFSGDLAVYVPKPRRTEGLEAVGETAFDMPNKYAWTSFATLDGNIFLSIAQAFAGDISDDGIKQAKDGLYCMMDMQAGKEHSVDYIVSVVTHSETSLAEDMATQYVVEAMGNTETAVEAHKQSWEDLWQSDIEVDGPIEDQLAVRSCLFNVLQNMREDEPWSVPPTGLSNNAFSGHVFWDAETWVFPAVLLLHPDIAKSVLDYRFRTLPGALENAFTNEQIGAEFAWESGYTGIEDVPKGVNYRHERHINGDIALACWQYFIATGDYQWLGSHGYPIIQATADYWTRRATFDEENGRYEILKVVGPDETSEIVDNNAYTNIIAKMNMQIAIEAAGVLGIPVNPEWRDVSRSMYIPVNMEKMRFTAYDEYTPTKAKQADTELIIYPLQYVPSDVEDVEELYTNTFDFYRPKVNEIGPAMSSSVHSVIAARLGRCEKAYGYFQDSFKPFFRGPFLQFNEKQSETWNTRYFVTGAGGVLQAVVFGICGVQMDYFPDSYNDAALKWKPCLPAKWKKVTIKGLKWRGLSYDCVIDKGGAKIKEKAQPEESD